MKSTCLGLFLLASATQACMSDAVCSADGSQCCFMNECVASSNLGCSGDRLKFHRHLSTLKSADELTKFAEDLRAKSMPVYRCDNEGIHCIDYVTRAMSDAGAFESLNGVATA